MENLFHWMPWENKIIWRTFKHDFLWTFPDCECHRPKLLSWRHKRIYPSLGSVITGSVVTAPDGDCRSTRPSHAQTHTCSLIHQLWSAVVCATPRRRVHRLNILYLIGRQNRGCIIKTFPSLFPISSTTLSHPPLCCVFFCSRFFKTTHCLWSALHSQCSPPHFCTLICQTGGEMWRAEEL